MSYKVSFSMHIEVEGMVDEEGVDLTDAKLKDALQKKIDWIDANPGQARAVTGKARDFAKEDRWVLRKTDERCMARKADAGWVDSHEITLEDTLTSSEASSMLLSYGAQGFWGRLEDMRSEPVLATLSSNDGAIVEKVDLTEWLATTHPSNITELWENDFTDCAAYGDAILHLLEDGQPSCQKLYAYLKTQDGTGIGLILDTPSEAVAFLKECRPDLHAILVERDFPSP